MTKPYRTILAPGVSVTCGSTSDGQPVATLTERDENTQSTMDIRQDPSGKTDIEFHSHAEAGSVKLDVDAIAVQSPDGIVSRRDSDGHIAINDQANASLLSVADRMKETCNSGGTLDKKCKILPMPSP
jgi:hypothetical protein